MQMGLWMLKSNWDNGLEYIEFNYPNIRLYMHISSEVTEESICYETPTLGYVLDNILNQ